MSFRLDTYNPYGKPDNKKNDPFGPLLTCKSMMAKCWHLFVNINRYQNSSDSFSPNPLWILHVHLYTVADYQSSDWMATIILWLTSPLSPADKASRHLYLIRSIQKRLQWDIDLFLFSFPQTSNNDCHSIYIIVAIVLWLSSRALKEWMATCTMYSIDPL